MTKVFARESRRSFLLPELVRQDGRLGRSAARNGDELARGEPGWLVLLEVGKADADEAPTARNDEAILGFAVTEQVHIHEAVGHVRVHGEKPELGLVVVARRSRQRDVGGRR